MGKYADSGGVRCGLLPRRVVGRRCVLRFGGHCRGKGKARKLLKRKGNATTRNRTRKLTGE